MRAKIFITGCLFIFSQVQASTFVGNGGSAGDIEVQVGFKVIQKTLKQIIQRDEDEEKPSHLCVCSVNLEGHPICDTLKKLTDKQSQFCSDHLRKHAKQLSLVAERISNQGFKMTRSTIEVNQKSGLRAVDAVADSQQQSLTVNQDRFLDLQDYARVFLLTHELGHLSKWDDQYIQDEQSFGPFTGDEGGRNFLNSIAAATTMRALEFRTFYQYQTILERSQGYKTHWIEWGSHSVASDKVEFGVPKTAGSELSYRYQFLGPWGVSGQIRAARGSEGYLTSTNAEEKISVYAVAVSYRIFPFSDPLSFLGQSHFVFSLGLENLSGSYKLNDAYNEIEATANSTSWGATVGYYIPVKYNFWVYCKVARQGHNYVYEIPYRSIAFKSGSILNLGVSYGF